MSLSPLGQGWTPLLTPVLAPLGPLDPTVLKRAQVLLDLVVTWNRRINLTAARDNGELCDLYFCDAAQLAASREKVGLTPEDTWVDVGSGGGPPGLCLAAIDPTITIELVEPRAKRVSFLRQAVDTLGLENCHVDRLRSDKLSDRVADAAVSRATFEPEEWAREGARLARKVVWILLSQLEVPEVPGWEKVLDQSYTLTHAPGSRRLIALSADHPDE